MRSPAWPTDEHHIDKDERPLVTRRAHDASVDPVGHGSGSAALSGCGRDEGPTDTVQKAPRGHVAQCVANRERLGGDRLSVDVEVPHGGQPMWKRNLRPLERCPAREAERVAPRAAPRTPVDGASLSTTPWASAAVRDAQVDPRGRKGRSRGEWWVSRVLEGTSECSDEVFFWSHVAFRSVLGKLAIDMQESARTRCAIDETVAFPGR